jgi:hypothetical protein
MVDGVDRQGRGVIGTIWVGGYKGGGVGAIDRGVGRVREGKMQ